jgi:[ribosomal protein S5]-alanine N-acetyltransferase
MSEIWTNRLFIRHLSEVDSPFIFTLLNDPAWIQYIGDKGIKTEEDAIRYIQTGPMKMYQDYGFGLYAVTLKDSGKPIGLCGLIKRPSFNDIDLGFAFLPDYRAKGYAYEAASAVLQYGEENLKLTKIVAITTLDNHHSQKLLIKLGFSFVEIVPYGESEEVKLFSLNLKQGDGSTVS